MHNKHAIPPKKGKQTSGEDIHTMADRGSRETQERVAADRTWKTRREDARGGGT